MIELRVDNRSTNLSRRSAASVPSTIEARKLKVTAAEASQRDGDNLARNSDVTELPLRIELPKSPWTTFPSHFAY